MTDGNTPPIPAALLEIVASSGLVGESCAVIQHAFCPFFIQAAEWQTKIATVTDPKLARESRLMLKKIRVEAEHKKDDLKGDAIKYSRAVDGAFRKIESAIKPMEAQLEEIETAAARADAERKAALKSEREVQLRAFDVDPTFFSLTEMPEEHFKKLLGQSRAGYEAKKAAEAKAIEDARLAAEKTERERITREQAEAAERERISVENERLRKEAAEREEAARIERERLAAERAAIEAENARQLAEQRRIADEAAAKAKAETDRVAAENKRALDAQRAKAAQEALLADEQAKRERQAVEAKAKAEREAREKLEAVVRAAHDREVKRQAEEVAELARRAAAPDKEKLAAFARLIRTLEVPEMSTKAGKLAAESVKNAVTELAQFIEAKGVQL
jgi:hypothetical protein